MVEVNAFLREAFHYKADVLWPSGLTLKTQQLFMTLQPLGTSTSSNTSCCLSRSSSVVHAFLHSFC